VVQYYVNGKLRIKKHLDNGTKQNIGIEGKYKLECKHRFNGPVLVVVKWIQSIIECLGLHQKPHYKSFRWAFALYKE
jgi:hypothetical protein